MHRTGFSANEDIAGFYKDIASLSNIHVIGLHVYDGHIIEQDFEIRKLHCNTAFNLVRQAVKQLELSRFPVREIIAGGSPTFLIHASTADVLCSPGTTVLWDKGYNDLLPELSFSYAAVLLTRIISKPVREFITTDLGYKSIASENPLNKRVFFLNLKNYTIISQDEEHLVIKVKESDWLQLNIGEALYGIPYHICPSVALYEKVQVVLDGRITDQWQVEARKRRISI